MGKTWTDWRQWRVHTWTVQGQLKGQVVPDNEMALGRFKWERGMI